MAYGATMPHFRAWQWGNLTGEIQLKPLKGHKPQILGVIKGIHPGRLTWNLRIDPWNRRFLLETMIFRFYVNLPGCNPYF